jgi:hypothetical protein
MLQTLSERSADVAHGYAIEANGITFLRTLLADEWEALGRDLGAKLNAWHWAVGDWLLHGEGIFGETVRSHVGFDQSRWDKPAELTGLSVHVLKQCYATSRAFALSHRVAGASWTRHAAAVALEADARIVTLRMSVANHWSSARWDEELAKSTRRNGPETPTGLARLARARKREDAALPPPNWQAATGDVATDSEREHIVVGVECPHCHQFIAEAALSALPRKERT